MAAWSGNRRARIIATIVLIGLAVYVSAYIKLRDRGLREAAQHDMPGMLYVACSNVEKTHDLTTHHFLATFFAPLNTVDRAFFGGRGPIKGIMWDLH